ncbi:MAG: hypothetical protein ACJASV_001364 [Pseudorhodobacter sp.]|jgi:hypothetical protein
MGRARQSQRRHWLAAAHLFGFPKPTADIPVTVTFTTDAKGVETWVRHFDGRIMRSTQAAGHGRNALLIVEAFGPFRFGLALALRDGKLRLIPRRWSLLGLALPRFLIPTGDRYEVEQEGRFRFHVTITLRVIGLMTRYQGWLRPTPNV